MHVLNPTALHISESPELDNAVLNADYVLMQTTLFVIPVTMLNVKLVSGKVMTAYSQFPQWIELNLFCLLSYATTPLLVAAFLILKL